MHIISILLDLLCSNSGLFPPRGSIVGTPGALWEMKSYGIGLGGKRGEFMSR